MDRDDRSRFSHERQDRLTLPPGLAALRHDVVRLDWAERDAYYRLLTAIEDHPPTREAYARWRCARDRHEVAQAKLDVLEAARRARPRRSG